jgi:hypothetical protein
VLPESLDEQPPNNVQPRPTARMTFNIRQSFMEPPFPGMTLAQIGAETQQTSLPNKPFCAAGAVQTAVPIRRSHPVCKTGRLRPIAVITKDQIVSKILAALHLPVSPELLADECTIVYDVTDQPMPGRVVGADPEPPEFEAEARGPPGDWEWIDPLSRED